MNGRKDFRLKANPETAPAFVQPDECYSKLVDRISTCTCVLLDFLIMFFTRYTHDTTQARPAGLLNSTAARRGMR